MEWTEESVRKLQQLMYQLDVTSLDKLIGDEEKNEHGEGTPVIEFLATNEVEENLDAIFTREALQKFINELRPGELKIITLRFGLDDNVPKTLKEVGQMFGITRERVRQIEDNALKKLRRILEKAGITSRNDI